LVEAELLYQRGLPPQATFTFKHALIQNAAYEALLKSTRQQYHQRIAQTLAERFVETAETQPELLAHHFTEAGLHEQALRYWQQAGERAGQRSANAEAIGHLTKGLELLRTLPDTPERTQQELTLRIALTPSLVATRGYAAPEVEQNYRRAQALCQQVDATPQLFQVLLGLRAFYLVRAELQAARELNEHLLRIARDLQDPLCLLVAHHSLGHTLLHLGAFLPARAHLEEGITRDASRHTRTQVPLTGGQDPEMFGLSWLAQALWVLGYPEQAVQRSNEALALAQERAHPFNLACALEYGIRLHRWRGELQTVQERSEALMTLSTAYGFAQQGAIGTIHRGRALTEHGHSEEGLALIHQGLAAYQATGALIRLPLFLAPFAEAQGKAGLVDEALTVCAEALEHVNRTGERWWEAELHRLKAELFLKQPIPDEHHAESCFHQALDVARNQQAKSLELRAAMSLSQLWQRQEKFKEAYDLLAPVYGWFTEGFDTADLREAKVLLQELE
jgi:predicted ATPase